MYHGCCSGKQGRPREWYEKRGIIGEIRDPVDAFVSIEVRLATETGGKDYLSKDMPIYPPRLESNRYRVYGHRVGSDRPPPPPRVAGWWIYIDHGWGGRRKHLCNTGPPPLFVSCESSYPNDNEGAMTLMKTDSYYRIIPDSCMP